MKFSTTTLAPLALHILPASAKLPQIRDAGTFSSITVGEKPHLSDESKAALRHRDLKSDTCSAVRYPPPSVRPPPEGGYQGHNFGQWTPPPAEYLYGTYYTTHMSYDQINSSFVNLRTERYPVFPLSQEFPAGSDAEIESWSTCSDPEAADCKDPDAVCTVFGYDIPIGAQGPTDKKYTTASSYAATGTLEGKVGGLRAIVAWGEDSDGFGYLAQYETGTDVNGFNGNRITIASRNQEGMTSVTYICLSSSLKQLAEELGDNELSALVSQIRPLKHDHRRDGEGPVECDASCVSNAAFDIQENSQLQRRSSPSMQLPLNIDNTETLLVYPLGGHRGGYLPWWGWVIVGCVFGIPLFGGLCIAVPIAAFRGHRRRKFARAQRAAMESTRAQDNSSVAEPQMIQTV